MSLETLIGGLTHDEQIVAMELLWKRLTTEDPSAALPEWHRSVVAERVAAIERGEEALKAFFRSDRFRVFCAFRGFGPCAKTIGLTTTYSNIDWGSKCRDVPCWGYLLLGRGCESCGGVLRRTVSIASTLTIDEVSW